MSRKIVVALAVLVVLGAVSAAFAQYEEDRPSRFGIRLASFFPMDSAFRDMKSIWMGPAVDWHLKFDESGRPDSYVSIAFLSTGEGNRKATDVPITYTRLRRTPLSTSKSRYTGIGFGVYRLTYRLRTSFGTTIFDESSTKPGAHVLFGFEWSDSFFGELRFDLLPRFRDRNWSGVFLNIGTRVSI